MLINGIMIAFLALVNMWIFLQRIICLLAREEGRERGRDKQREGGEGGGGGRKERVCEESRKVWKI